MKRILRALLLSLVLGILVVTNIFATTPTWNYLFPIYVLDTSAGNRTYYPVDLSGTTGVGGYSLYASQRTLASGLDTNMQNGTDIPFMIASDRLMAVVPSLPANSKQNLGLYTGWTPNQTAYSMIVGSGGYVTTIDNAALEPADTFVFEVGGYVDTSSGTGKYLVNKSGAFTLDAGSTTAGKITAGIYDTVSADTSAVRPNGAGYTTNLTPSAGANWQCVSNNSDATFVYKATTGTGSDAYALASSGLASSDHINSVTVYFRVSENNGSDCGAVPFLYLNGSTQNGSSQGLSVAWTTYNQTIARPGGGSWSYSDLSSLQVGITLTSTVNIARCSELWITINYTSFEASVDATVSSGVHDIQVQADGNVFELDIDNPTLIANGLFSVGNPPLGWSTANGFATLSQDINIIKIGNYSLKAVNGTGNADFIYYPIVGWNDLKGTTITLKMWLDSTQPNKAQLAINDGVTETVGSYHPGDSQWDLMTLTKTISNSATKLWVGFREEANTIETYASGVTCVVGSILPTITSTSINTVALSGASVPDNANNWLINQNNVMPYMTYYKESVSGTEKLKYQPNYVVGDATYSTGTATFTQGSKSVVGSGTTWTSAMVGCLIKPSADTAYYTVATFVDTTHLTLTENYTPATATGSAYNIITAFQDMDNKTYVGTITWGTNSGITLTYGQMVSYNSYSSGTSNTTGYTLQTMSIPGSMYANGDQDSGLPLYDNIREIANSMNQSVNTPYFLFIVGVAIGLFVLTLSGTKSLFLAAVVFNVVLFMGTGNHVVPLWLPISTTIASFAITYLQQPFRM